MSLLFLLPMSLAGCHDALVVVVLHVIQQDLLEPGNGGMGEWRYEIMRCGIWPAYSPAFS